MQNKALLVSGEEKKPANVHEAVIDITSVGEKKQHQT